MKSIADRYLDLLESSLTGMLDRDDPFEPWSPNTTYDAGTRALGRDWPSRAKTMIGMARMRNIRECCEKVLVNGVPGDFIETGVWRGGACIYMKGILETYLDRKRRVFVADSFQGLPEPNLAEYPADKADTHHLFEQLRVSREQVADNFRDYNLLDERVVFLEGWFKDTLPTAPIEQLAILRLDGDMYESTIQALTALYPKLSDGGFCIIDDYNLPNCVRAVEDYRAQHSITSYAHQIDGNGVYWQK